jgi:hypothetical protein
MTAAFISWWLLGGEKWPSFKFECILRVQLMRFDEELAVTECKKQAKENTRAGLQPPERWSRYLLK